MMDNDKSILFGTIMGHQNDSLKPGWKYGTKKRIAAYMAIYPFLLIFMVPGAGVEPARSKASR
ncbi:MAG: hypothetical protein ACOCUL_04695, partial [Bacteroidota bacterium]